MFKYLPQYAMPIMKFDTTQEGLLTVFKPYQAVLMEHIWDLNENEKVGITSGEAHQFLSGKPEKVESRRHQLPE